MVDPGVRLRSTLSGNMTDHLEIAVKFAQMVLRLQFKRQLHRQQRHKWQRHGWPLRRQRH